MEDRKDRESMDGRGTRRNACSSHCFEPLTVMRGGREVVVYGCRKILLYTPGEIRLAVKKQCLCVCGEALFCTSFSGGAVTVEGKIEAIRYGDAVAERRET